MIAVLFTVVSAANAQISIGISPAERHVQLQENQVTSVFFAVSQSSENSEDVTMQTNVGWLDIEEKNFVLGSYEQKFVKVNVGPMPVGEHDGEITASASIVGTVGVRSFVVSKVHLTISPTNKTVEEIGLEIDTALDAIESAENAIIEARKLGFDTSAAEAALARALEEYDKKNYATAKDFADNAYSIANALIESARQDVEPQLTTIKIALIVVGILAPTVIAAYMIIFMVAKRCPVCGGKLKLEYKGEKIVSYRCQNCKYYTVKEKGAK